MSVIEADGQNTEPELVDSIQIFAGRLSQIPSSRGNLQIPNQKGQRYSFVVSGLINCNTKMSSLRLYSFTQTRP